MLHWVHRWSFEIGHLVLIPHSEPWAVADPGFPVGGGADLLGGANLQCIHFSAKMYAKMKEIDPVGGHALVAPPGSANDGGLC